MEHGNQFTVEQVKGSFKASIPALRLMSIGVVYGGVSPEDRLYIEACPYGDWSLKAILDCLREMGINAEHIDPTETDVVDRLKQFDLIFLNAHGEYGEDGRLQGLLDYLQLPYTHCGVLAGSVGCDKILSKAVFKQLGILTPGFQAITDHNDSTPHISKFPAMLKTANGGSSVGTLLVANDEELNQGMGALRSEGQERLLVEEYVDGRSVTVGLLDMPTGTTILPVLECIPPGEFYDEEAKLGQDSEAKASYRVPDDFTQEFTEVLQQQALEVYKRLGCKGAARVDFIVDNDHRAYALEINTIPGLQRDSNIVAAGQTIGLSFEDIVMALVCQALTDNNRAPWHHSSAATHVSG